MNLYDVVTKQPSEVVNCREDVERVGNKVLEWCKENGLTSGEAIGEMIADSLAATSKHLDLIQAAREGGGKIPLQLLFTYSGNVIDFNPTNPRAYITRKMIADMVGSEEEPSIAKDFYDVFTFGFGIGFALFREYAKTLTEHQLKDL